MRDRLRVICVVLGVAAAAPVGAQSPCEDPMEACSDLVSRSCLLSLGAGALAASDQTEGCADQLDQYRDCLATIAAECEPSPSPAALEFRDFMAPVAVMVSAHPPPATNTIMVVNESGFSFSLKAFSVFAYRERLSLIDDVTTSIDPRNFGGFVALDATIETDTDAVIICMQAEIDEFQDLISRVVAYGVGAERSGSGFELKTIYRPLTVRESAMGACQDYAQRFVVERIRGD